MTLDALIRGVRAIESGKSATATPATPATPGDEGGRTVATVATVAVANPRREEIKPLPDALAEVRRLIEAIANVSPYWTRQDVDEAIQIAQGDLDNALMTYRELAKQYGARAH